jgi:hypothetical protein
MSTLSVVSPNMQVYKEDSVEMAAQKTPKLGQRNARVAIIENQLYAMQNLNHDKEKGKSSEI